MAFRSVVANLYGASRSTNETGDSWSTRESRSQGRDSEKFLVVFSPNHYVIQTAEHSWCTGWTNWVLHPKLINSNQIEHQMALSPELNEIFTQFTPTMYYFQSHFKSLRVKWGLTCIGLWLHYPIWDQMSWLLRLLLLLNRSRSLKNWYIRYSGLWIQEKDE